MISSNLYDAFGVLRYEQGSAETPVVRNGLRKGEEGLYWRGEQMFMAPTDLLLPLAPGYQGPVPPNDLRQWCNEWVNKCLREAKARLDNCLDYYKDVRNACLMGCVLLGIFNPGTGGVCVAACLGAYYVGRARCHRQYDKDRQACWKGYNACLSGVPWNNPPSFFPVDPVPLPPSSQPPALE